ncbi:hypothetical protein KQX54_005168 [Cotesia glomerata]|uniref:Uncharacterized protein n=1 Tax=Cotesia glomerata TaxID=32391 RepID=A0AAV7I0B5_COTGL|nr:hypothetical protein KQX54_005168 [Cotesia glomerata]
MDVIYWSPWIMTRDDGASAEIRTFQMTMIIIMMTVMEQNIVGERRREVGRVAEGENEKRRDASWTALDVAFRVHPHLSCSPQQPSPPCSSPSFSPHLSKHPSIHLSAEKERAEWSGEWYLLLVRLLISPQSHQSRRAEPVTLWSEPSSTGSVPTPPLSRTPSSETSFAPRASFSPRWLLLLLLPFTLLQNPLFFEKLPLDRS